MFKKKPNLRTLAPLRSSDRRKITDQIIAEYHLQIVKEDDDDANTDEQAKTLAGINALRSSLLPDGSLSAKFSTTTGPDLKILNGIVYIGARLGEDQRILWFKIGEKIYPTVYTLWKNPNIIPLLHTPDVVLRKMRGGADLMTPGLANGPPFPSKANKGSTVAVASLELPTVPMVVGICEIDVCTLSSVQGAKGHAVRSLHWCGDEIWGWSHGGKPGGSVPSIIDGWNIAEDSSSRALDDKAAEMTVSRIEAGSFEQDLPAEHGNPESKDDHNTYVNGEDGTPWERVSVQRKELTSKEVDDIFRNAFLFAIYQHRETHPNDVRHGLDFPIPQSLFVSNLILPFLPAFTEEDTNAMQIKKTSWKSAKKFIKALEKEKLLKSKDRSGGEVVIQDVDFGDLAISNFKPYELPQKDTKALDNGGGGGGGGGERAAISATSINDESVGQQLKKLSLLKPKEKLAPVFNSTGSNLHSFYLPAELSLIITAYIESENLVATTNKRLVNLNPILANAVFDGQSSMDREVLVKGTVPRDALIDRIISSCTQYWAILRNDETRDQVKPKAGPAPTIKIILETRSGNKTVSKVSGMEAFYVSPQPLADELQKACASSISINQLVGGKVGAMEIMIQGPQKDMITKALEKRGVSRSWIEVLDKTKAKKR
ncbi:hypothetical protein MMC17_009181 [Xylographa soralifera]|nr:hypothetical protein [Xylographa soralifera]